MTTAHVTDVDAAVADIDDGATVLRAAGAGIGAFFSPTGADHLSPRQEVVLHTENGMLGMGRAAVGDEIDPDLINAGKVPVIETPGASYVHHADSFAMMRGGHLDVCLLGAFQVSTTGDLATGTPALPTPSRPWAAPWTSPSAPSRSS